MNSFGYIKGSHVRSLLQYRPLVLFSSGPKDEKLIEARESILKLAMTHVKDYGWRGSMEKACIEKGLSPVCLGGLFSPWRQSTNKDLFLNGIMFGPLLFGKFADIVSNITGISKSDALIDDSSLSLIEYFIQEGRISLEANIKEPFNSQLLKDKLYHCVWHHLTRRQDISEAWTEALGSLYLRRPQLLMSWVAHTSDHIWNLCGDDSIDMQWYTRRIGLAYVIASSEIYMIQDQSEQFKLTADFLARQLDWMEQTRHVKRQLASQLDLFQSIWRDYSDKSIASEEIRK